MDDMLKKPQHIPRQAGAIGLNADGHAPSGLARPIGRRLNQRRHQRRLATGELKMKARTSCCGQTDSLLKDGHGHVRGPFGVPVITIAATQIAASGQGQYEITDVHWNRYQARRPAALTPFDAKVKGAAGPPATALRSRMKPRT